MKANIKSLRKYRRYSQDFKKEIVSEFESEKLNVPRLGKLHVISDQSFYN